MSDAAAATRAAAGRVMAHRREQQAALVARARAFAAALDARLEPVAVVVVGSVARGDFNAWSDLDVLVVAERLRGSVLDRLQVVGASAPPGLSPAPWTPQEYLGRLARGDIMAVEAATIGIVVRGRLPRGDPGRRPGGVDALPAPPAPPT